MVSYGGICCFLAALPMLRESRRDAVESLCHAWEACLTLFLFADPFALKMGAHGRRLLLVGPETTRHRAPAGTAGSTPCRPPSRRSTHKPSIPRRPNG